MRQDIGRVLLGILIVSVVLSPLAGLFIDQKDLKDMLNTYDIYFTILSFVAFALIFL
jgi:hypothetical protein